MIVRKNKFSSKRYGRIYVYHEKDIQVVKDIIKDMDDFEYEYLPMTLITTVDKFPEIVYVGKFDDLDLDELAVRCVKQNIPVFCFNPKPNFSDGTWDDVVIFPDN